MLRSGEHEMQRTGEGDCCDARECPLQQRARRADASAEERAESDKKNSRSSSTSSLSRSRASYCSGSSDSCSERMLPVRPGGAPAQSTGDAAAPAASAPPVTDDSIGDPLSTPRPMKKPAIDETVYDIHFTEVVDLAWFGLLKLGRASQPARTSLTGSSLRSPQRGAVMR